MNRQKIFLFTLLCCTLSQPALAETPLHTAPIPSIAPVPAEAEDVLALSDALTEAYRRNPDLEAIRAELRAVDEQHAQALSGFRPSVTSAANYTSSTNNGDTIKTSADQKTLSITLTQPVYSGGSTLAAINRADNTIKAERTRLIATEQTVLLAAVTAYMNVLRDREIVDLNISNENVLKSHLDAAREQFRLGSVTKTDVSQSEARLAAAVAARLAASGNLKIDQADFEKVIGVLPGNLSKPTLLLPVPGTIEEALSEGLRLNPLFLQAQYTSAAAKATTQEIQGTLLPSVNLNGSVGKTYGPVTGIDNTTNQKSVVLSATLPFYSAGGSTYSQIRAARQTETQRRREIDSTERSVRQAVVDAWETLSTANAQNEAQRVQIEAETLAREGVRVEREYGARTIINLLDAEQEYLNARVAHVISDRDKTVATYGLLAAIGKLTAENLHLNTAIYNPLHNLQQVQNKWTGTTVEQSR
jgi:TolC family type I secretion outer membrane protein